MFIFSRQFSISLSPRAISYIIRQMSMQFSDFDDTLFMRELRKFILTFGLQSLCSFMSQKAKIFLVYLKRLWRKNQSQIFSLLNRSKVHSAKSTCLSMTLLILFSMNSFKPSFFYRMVMVKQKIIAYFKVFFSTSMSNLSLFVSIPSKYLVYYLEKRMF